MPNDFDTKNVKGHEKVFSNQLFNRFLYDGDQEVYEKKCFDFLNEFSKIKFSQERFYGSQRHTLDEMASSPASVAFVCFLASMIQPKLVIEIGTFVGFATINLAAKLDSEAKIIAIEKFDEFAEITIKNAKACGVIDQIEIKVGDAKEILPNLELVPNSVDLAFVDGNKEDYLTYIKIFESVLSDKGLIVMDDCFFHGDVLNEKYKTEKGEGVADAVDYIIESEDLTVCFLPISNGIALIKKP